MTAGAPTPASNEEPATQSHEIPDAFDRYTLIIDPYTSEVARMRTNIDIDDKLMRRAMRSSGARTKRGAVEEGLRLLIQTRGQRAIRRLRSKVAWEGDLEPVAARPRAGVGRGGPRRDDGLGRLLPRCW